MKTIFALTMMCTTLTAVPAIAAKGQASVRGTAPGSAITGTATFEDTKNGLKVVARITGVTTGAHGFHIHEFGSCEDSGKAAGGHYNPRHAPHGQALDKGPKKAHAGDLGNVTADMAGNVLVDVTLPKVSLAEGKFTVGGRALVLHEKADDFSQPLGNAGGRVGCGVIVITP